MKYAPLDAPMQALLHRQGLATFDPYRFDDATIASVLDMLRTGGEVASAPASPTAPPVALHLNGWVLAVALLALGIAALA